MRQASRPWVRSRDLLVDLTIRDIKLRYRGSVLGVLWTLLNPLAELVVLWLVFVKVFHVAIPNFAAYLFTGLLVYGWFQNSLNFVTGAIVGNRELVRRPGVPVAILPVVTVASNLVHFALSLPILFGLLWISGIAITPALLALPGLVALEFVLILACAYPIATMHVWFRDTQHVLRVALQLLFYLTPIFYRVTDVPPGLAPVYRLNPVGHLVEAYRSVLLDGALPRLSSVAYLLLLSSGLLLVGMAWFRRASRQFADEV